MFAVPAPLIVTSPLLLSTTATAVLSEVKVAATVMAFVRALVNDVSVVVFAMLLIHFSRYAQALRWSVLLDSFSPFSIIPRSKHGAPNA